VATSRPSPLALPPNLFARSAEQCLQAAPDNQQTYRHRRLTAWHVRSCLHCQEFAYAAIPVVAAAERDKARRQQASNVTQRSRENSSGYHRHRSVIFVLILPIPLPSPLS